MNVEYRPDKRDPLVVVLCPDVVVAQDISEVVAGVLPARVAILTDQMSVSNFLRHGNSVNIVIAKLPADSVVGCKLLNATSNDKHVVLIAEAPPSGWIERGQGRHHFVHSPFNSTMLARAIQRITSDLCDAPPSSPS